MPQVTTGVRFLLNMPQVYDFFLDSLGARNVRRYYIEKHVRPRAADRILDIGCGTGAIVDFLPADVHYLGVDLSAEYIAAAERRFGQRARFRVADVNALQIGTQDRFDIVTAFGLLHHLGDEEVRRLAKTVGGLLDAGGRFVTLDNCFTADQSPLARTLIRWDRGRNVRAPDAYRDLIAGEFAQVRCDVRHDLFRIPYTHVIMEATAP